MQVNRLFLFTPSYNTTGKYKGKKIFHHLKGNINFVQHSSERNRGTHCNKLPNDSETEPPVL